MAILARVVPSPVKRLAGKWLNQMLFERKLRRATPVLVFQMGKVGSLSVHFSLSRQYAGAVAHAHDFSSDHHDPQVRRLYHWAISEARPLNVISLTREPIARNVSAFFQCFERETGVPHASATYSLEELKAIFLSKYSHDLPLAWFDKNILANFGIDVFATPFPAEGVCSYTHKNIRLLVVRSEIDDQEKATAIGDFLDLPAFQLGNTNVGEEKDYAATYKAFKSKIKLPPDYIARMCGSKYFNHFYNQETVDAAKEKWSDT